MNKKGPKTKPIIGERTQSAADFSTKTITFLDSNIPYFVFIDTATSPLTEESAIFRCEFDFYLSRNVSENGQEIPIVTLVLGGTEGTLNSVSRSVVKYQIPCIFVESCGKCAAVFSHFLKSDSDYVAGTKRITNELVAEKINEFIMKQTSEDAEAFDGIRKQIIDMLEPENRHCISILSENDKLDTVIISALSKKKTARKRLLDLSLALTWNRIDLAHANLGKSTHINLVSLFFLSDIYIYPLIYHVTYLRLEFEIRVG